MDETKLTLEQFGQKVKMKYPEYNGLSDREIGEKTIQKYPDYASKIKPDEGFIADLKGIASGIKESAIKRSDNFGEIDKAVATGETTQARSLLQKFGQGAGFASDIIGETIMGGIKALTPQGVQSKVGSAVESGAKAVAETEPVKNLIGWYNNLDETKKKDIDAVLGVASLGTDIIGGAVLKKPVQEGAEAIIKKAGSVVDDVVDTVPKATAKLKTVAQEAISPTPTLKEATGQVLQGKTKDLKFGQEALQSIDTTDVKTFKDLDNKLTENVRTLAKQVDDDLGVDTTKIPLNDLSTVAKTKAGTDVSTNYVETALNQLEELYDKTGDAVAKADIQELIGLAKAEGLTRLEVNDIARTYGREFGQKAFGKTGDPLTSVNAQMFENTRKGVKEVARKGINGAEAKSADELMSKLLNTQTLIKKNVEAVNKLQQRIKERGLAEKLGYMVAKYADVLTGGTLRGIVGGILPRGAGYKTLNALDLEDLLAKNLKVIQDAQKAKTVKEFETIMKKLDVDESFSQATVPKTVRVWNKSKFSNDGAYADIPVTRRVDNITLYQGGSSEGRQFWTPDKKYASQFGEVTEKTGSFYKVDNGNRVTDVYVEVPSKSAMMDSFEKAPDLSPENRAIETKAFQKIIDNEPSLLEEYKRIDGTKGGKVINTDEFRKLFKDEGYAGYNAVAVQEPSSYLAKKAFTNILKNPEENVAFLAGGSGTGKSSAVKGVPEIAEAMSQSAGVLDSNLSNYGSAMKKIKEVLEAGKTPVITFVYRDPMDAFENGVVKRMLDNVEEGGRLVPSNVVAGNHIDSWGVVQKLYNEGVEVNFIDNSLGFQKAKLVPFDELKKKIKYPSKEELTELFNSKARELYGAGRIKTLDQLNGYLNQ